MPVPMLKEEYFTYADYLSWDDGERYELIDGVPYMLAAPSRRHQEIARELVLQLGNFLRDKPCRVYFAPFDVRLFEKKGDRPEDVDTVVQPDIAVICDRDKLDAAGARGAPDFVIEILSPSNTKAERIRKFRLYERAGVREYWMIGSHANYVEAFTREDDRFVPSDILVGGGTLPVSVLEGCEIDLDRVFAE